jgi:hypothetical protein
VLPVALHSTMILSRRIPDLAMMSREQGWRLVKSLLRVEGAHSAGHHTAPQNVVVNFSVVSGVRSVDERIVIIKKAKIVHSGSRPEASPGHEPRGNRIVWRHAENTQRSWEGAVSTAREARFNSEIAPL